MTWVMEAMILMPRPNSVGVFFHPDTQAPAPTAFALILVVGGASLRGGHGVSRDLVHC